MFVMIYTGILWFLTVSISLCLKRKEFVSDFTSFTLAQLVMLPIYGRIFGWW